MTCPTCGGPVGAQYHVSQATGDDRFCSSTCRNVDPRYAVPAHAVRLRFEERVARILARPEPDPWVTCVHCELPVNRLLEDVLDCPGCRRMVCRECYQHRRTYTRQTCRTESV